MLFGLCQYLVKKIEKSESCIEDEESERKICDSLQNSIYQNTSEDVFIQTTTFVLTYTKMVTFIKAKKVNNLKDIIDEEPYTSDLLMLASR